MARSASAERLTTSAPPAGTEPRCLPVRLLRARQLGPTLRRLTLAGEGLTTFAPRGPDEYFGLVLPPPGQDVPRLGGPDPRGAVAAIPAARRPHLRWYTVRRHRPDLGEVDVDMVTHGDDGRASHWAGTARPGDRVGFHEAGAVYTPPSGAGAELLVGDETALPAIGAILEQTPAHPDRRVVVEVPHPDDVQDLGDARVTWVVRATAGPGAVLAAALRSAEGVEHAWVCGEAGTVTAVRSRLLRAGLARERITHSGYWCRGRARP